MLLASLGEASVVTAGGDLESGERDAAAGLEEPQVVVPVHLFKGAISACSAVRHAAQNPQIWTVSALR